MKMVVVRTQEQMNMIIDMLNLSGIKTLHLERLRDSLPICVNPINGGWTDHFDRAIDYIEFKEYMGY